MGRDASTGTISFDGRELRTGTDRFMDPDFFDQLESAMAAIARGYDAQRVTPVVNPDRGWLMTAHPPAARRSPTRPRTRSSTTPARCSATRACTWPTPLCFPIPRVCPRR